MRTFVGNSSVARVVTYVATCVVACGLAVLCSGCGQGEYEKLMKTRIEELNDPSKYGILIWEEIANPDLKYSVLMPKAESVTTPEETDAMQGETRDLVFGSTRYQIRCQTFNKGIEMETIAAAVEKQYRETGYEDIPEEERDFSPPKISRSLKSLYLKHAEDGFARVEVVAFDRRTVCTMAVLGAELPHDDCDKFFKSAKANLPKRRSRR